MREPLAAIFNPRSVAVFGASTAMHRFGARRFRSLIEAGFEGPIYPIHPQAPEVLGYKTYRTLHDVPERVDLVVVMVRSELVDGIIEDCAALRIPGVIVLTGGFGETGAAGRERERLLGEKLRAAGGRMVGTNCAGLYSGSGRVNVLGWRSVQQGPIGLISQSGNMARTFAQQARTLGLGFSKIVSIGNAADLKPTDYIEYLFGDPDTKVIVCYVEGFGFGEGRAFFELLRAHPQRKPVIVLKPGVTEIGRRAALSHTGSLAGENRIVDAALRQCGALRAEDSEEAWAAAVALASMPRMSAPGVVVVSDGGGHATIVADTAARVGLTLPELSAATQALLAELLPPRSTMNNPVDFAGKAEEDPGIVPRVIDICLGAEGIGGVILAGHFGGYFKDRTEATAEQEIAAGHALADAVRKHGKAFVLHTVYGPEPLAALEPLRQASVPIFGSLELSARAMGMLWRESQHAARVRPSATREIRVDRAAVDAILEQARGTPPRLAEPEARALLALCGVPQPEFRIANTSADAQTAVKEFAALVAMKLISTDLVHKSDAGGVQLGIAGAAAARKAYEALMETGKRLALSDARVLITPMISGVEVVVGGFRDDHFGPVVMCGLGGIFVEVLDDVAFRLAPLDLEQARAMIGELRGAKIFGAFRGRAALDVGALCELLVRVSELLMDVPQIAELDINPLFVRPEGVAIADARVVLA